MNREVDPLRMWQALLAARREMIMMFQVRMGMVNYGRLSERQRYLIEELALHEASRASQFPEKRVSAWATYARIMAHILMKIADDVPNSNQWYEYHHSMTYNWKSHMSGGGLLCTFSPALVWSQGTYHFHPFCKRAGNPPTLLPKWFLDPDTLLPVPPGQTGYSDDLA